MHCRRIVNVTQADPRPRCVICPPQAPDQDGAGDLPAQSFGLTGQELPAPPGKGAPKARRTGTTGLRSIGAAARRPPLPRRSAPQLRPPGPQRQGRGGAGL